MSALARVVSKKIAKRQAWAGAADSRLNDFIFSTIQSANQETRYELVKLRARSRELCRNNPNAKRFLALISQNVVGHRGVRLECQLTLRTGPNAGQPDELNNDRIETAWDDWGRVGSCDVSRKHSWVSLQQLIMRTVARDGEAIIRLVEGYPNDYGFALQLIDPDQLDETYTVRGEGNRIEQGVELDRWGAPIAYYVWTSHPQDPINERRRERVPADQIIHLFVEERAGQARGVPWLAPVIVQMRMLDGYSEAELVAARTAAAKMGWIKNTDESPGADPDTIPGTTYAMNAEPGSIEQLGVGQDFISWDPTHPAGNFEPFVLAQQRLMAMGLNVSHMSLTGDLRQANYSSARVGLLDERDGWRCLQAWFAGHLHDRVYRRWLRVASLTPKLKLPTYDLTKYEDVCWRPRGWDWVDPLKDLEAAALAVDRGFQSPIDIVAESGDELADVYASIAKAKKLAESYGLEFATGVNPRPAPDKVAGAGDATDPATNATGNGRALALRPITVNGNGRKG